jgi:hypothetical protein
MAFAEDSNKVQKIVAGSYASLRRLYSEHAGLALMPELQAGMEHQPGRTYGKNGLAHTSFRVPCQDVQRRWVARLPAVRDHILWRTPWGKPQHAGTVASWRGGWGWVSPHQ